MTTTQNAKELCERLEKVVDRSLVWKAPLAQEAAALIRHQAERMDRLEKALAEVVQWADAYPEDIFPAPDFKAVQTALEAAGLSLGAVSASNMRHVVSGVGQIARAALATEG